MTSFTPFVTLLAEIEDPRRAEGKLYGLPHVVLFAILGIVAGANSNEIPALQSLLGALGLIGAVVTVDAMHCQKKHSNEPLQAAFT